MFSNKNISKLLKATHRKVQRRQYGISSITTALAKFRYTWKFCENSMSGVLRFTWKTIVLENSLKMFGKLMENPCRGFLQNPRHGKWPCWRFFEEIRYCSCWTCGGATVDLPRPAGCQKATRVKFTCNKPGRLFVTFWAGAKVVPLEAKLDASVFKSPYLVG